MKQVCDPGQDRNVWHDVEAPTDRHAVQAWLEQDGYDPLDYDHERPLTFLVRDSVDGDPRIVIVRVVPARFEVR